MKTLLSGLALTLSLVLPGVGAVKTWDGGGDGTSWTNAANWNGDILPVAGDEVVIDVPGTNATITYTASATLTLRNLQCEEMLSLSAGGLTVTNGASWVHGGFVMAPDRVLTAKGSGTSFTASGPTAINGGFLFAQSGAALSLPDCGSYSDTSGCCGSTIEASGANSVVDLSGVTNLTGNPTWAMALRAVSGGQLWLSNLTRIEISATSVFADGTNSLIRLPAFTTFPGTGGSLSFEVRNAAQIEMPLFAGAPRVDYTKRTGGALPLSQFTTLSLGSLLVEDGSDLVLPLVTNLSGASLTASGGSALHFPATSTAADTSGCCGAVWLATGAGSLLNLPALTTLTGNPTWAMQVQAVSGGRIELTNLASVPNSLLTLKATGTSSLINVPWLTGPTRTSGLLTLDTGSGGMITCSNLLSGQRVTVVRRAGGVLPVEQFRSLTLGSLTLEDGLSATFSGLTNLDGAALILRNGSQAIFPAVAFFTDTSGCCGTTWEVSGVGSFLGFPALIGFAGNPTWSMSVNVLSGGELAMNSLLAVSPSLTTMKADGTNSLINLASLVTAAGSSGQFNLEARNAGTILAPNLVDGQRVGLTLRTNSTLLAPLVSRLLNLTVDGVSVALPGVTNLTSAGSLTLLNAAYLALAGVTNLDGQSLSVSGGSTLSLSGVQSYRDTGGCCGAQWTATGAGSTLDLPWLATFTGHPTWTTRLQASSGGRLGLASLRTIGAGRLQIVAEGTNSLASLQSLETFAGLTDTLTLEARSTARMELGTNVTTLARTTISLQTNSTITARALALESGSLLAGAGRLVGNLTNWAEVRSTGPALTLDGDYTGHAGSKLTFSALAPGTNTGLSTLVVTGLVTLNGAIGLTSPIYETLGNAYTVVSNVGPNLIAGTFTNAGLRIGGGEGAFQPFVNVGDGNDVILVRPFLSLTVTNGTPVLIRALACDYAATYPLTLAPGARHLPGAGAAGVPVNLQASTNLLDWTTIYAGLSDTNGLIEYLDTSGLDARFYRTDLP